MNSIGALHEIDHGRRRFLGTAAAASDTTCLRKPRRRLHKL